MMPPAATSATCGGTRGPVRRCVIALLHTYTKYAHPSTHEHPRTRDFYTLLALAARRCVIALGTNS
jgi:hypothetical protein